MATDTAEQKRRWNSMPSDELFLKTTNAVRDLCSMLTAIEHDRQHIEIDRYTKTACVDILAIHSKYVRSRKAHIDEEASVTLARAIRDIYDRLEEYEGSAYDVDTRISDAMLKVNIEPTSARVARLKKTRREIIDLDGAVEASYATVASLFGVSPHTIRNREDRIRGQQAQIDEETVAKMTADMKATYSLVSNGKFSARASGHEIQRALARARIRPTDRLLRMLTKSKSGIEKLGGPAAAAGHVVTQLFDSGDAGVTLRGRTTKGRTERSVDLETSAQGEHSDRRGWFPRESTSDFGVAEDDMEDFVLKKILRYSSRTIFLARNAHWSEPAFPDG